MISNSLSPKLPVSLSFKAMNDKESNIAISNGIKKNMEAQNMNFLHADKFQKKRKNDSLPDVGIIDTPPQNKAPIANELNKKYDVEDVKNKKKQKKQHKTKNVSGFFALAALVIGLFVTLNESFELFKRIR